MPKLVFYEKLPTMRQLTCLLVREAMKQSRGNLDQAAKLLGISRQTALRYVMQEFSRM